MHILVVADEGQKKEFLSCLNDQENFTFAANLPDENEYKNYDVFFLFSKSNLAINFDLFENKIVFINEVIKTLSELNYPENLVRMNGWRGFIERKTWEVVTKDLNSAESISKLIGRNLIPVEDQPGLVAARVLSMVINEAYFAIEEKISTQEEIDMAMKLGTNYPFGPFEWAEKIGIDNIYNLLDSLSKKDPRYLPANQLKKEFLKKAFK